MAVFEVLLVEQPTKKEAEEGKLEKVVFGPKLVVAKDPQSAGVVAVNGETCIQGINMDKVSVLIRPF